MRMPPSALRLTSVRAASAWLRGRPLAV